MLFQFDLFGNHDIPEEVLLAEAVSKEYDWRRIEAELEPRFRKAAVEFHNRNNPKESPTEDHPVLLSFHHQEEAGESSDDNQYTTFQKLVTFFRKRNPKGAGRKPHSFLACVKAFLLAALFHIEQDSTHIANTLRTNPYFLTLCGFCRPPSARTLQDFDQIMREAGLWEAMEKMTFHKNIDTGVIKLEQEDTLNIDPTDLPADSTPGKKKKACRECPYFKTCKHPEPTDETAGWYQKSKWKGSYAHMFTASQLAHSGAPFSFVVQNGKIDERESLAPLLEKGKMQHPEFTFQHINADGIFNNKACRQAVQKSYPGAELRSPVNAGRRKDLPNFAHGIEKIKKNGKVICMEGHTMVYMGKDNRNEAYCFACPVYNPKARKRAEQMFHLELPPSCSSKDFCSPLAEQGRYLRVSCKRMPQLDPNMPQGSYRFWRIYRLRTKIERLFGRLKVGFRMAIFNVRGRLSIEALVSKYFSLQHVLAFITGSYGV
jgi:hypothetical protein